MKMKIKDIMLYLKSYYIHCVHAIGVFLNHYLNMKGKKRFRQEI